MADEDPKAGPIEEEAPPSEPKAPSPQELLEQKERELAEMTDTAKRIQAEFDNFKKRNGREWSDKVKLANRKLITDLLPVLDSFEKAVEDAKNNHSPESFRKGLEGLQRQLIKILEKEGLRQIGTDGKLDPFVHEVLMQEESEDAEDGQILEVFQKGYSLDGDTIRTSKVKVAKRIEATPPERGTQEQDQDTQNNLETSEKKESDKGDE